MSISEEEEYLAMIHRYSGIITKICYYYATDADDFNDLRQDVLANIWQSRNSFRHEASESTWIYRLSLNTCITNFRKRKRNPSTVPIELIAEPEAEKSDALARHNELHALISRLNLREKSLILMWLDEMSYERISAITGMPRNTVAVQLHRAKEKLKKIANEINR